MSSLRRAAVALLALSGMLTGIVASPGPAAAEIDSTSRTNWGLATAGTSRTVGQWNALGWAVEQVGNTVFVGGKFQDVTNGSTTVRQPHLAAFDADTGRWRSWFTPRVGSPVLALEASPDGGLFIGGEIDSWNGVTIGALQKIDPATGERWPGWTTRVYGGNSAVQDLHLGGDGWLYVVGNFTTVSRAGVTEPAAKAVRIDPVTGAIDSGWKPMVSASGSVWGVTTSETRDLVYLSGAFLSVNGLPNTGGFVGLDDTARVEVDRSVVPFNGCTSVTNTYCVTLYDVEATAEGTVFVGGVEHALYVLDEKGGHSMIRQHYTGCDPARNEVCRPRDWFGGEFQELAVHGDRVYAVCHCWHDFYSDTTLIRHTQPHGVHSTVSSISALDAATGHRVEAFRPHLTGNAGGWALHVNEADGCLWVAGGFASVGPEGARRAARDLVRLCDETGPGPAALPATPPPPPPSCTVTLDGSVANISWPPQHGSSAAVIERQVDDGRWSWRGRVDAPALTFVETAATDAVTAYRVTYRYPAGQISEATACSPDADLRSRLDPPQSCSVTVEADTAIVTWTAGRGAASHVVYRSVDGGPVHWRGRVDLPATSAVDPLVAGPLHRYSVRGRSATGALSEPTPCTPEVQVSPPVTAPVASCNATADGASVVIDWPVSPSAVSYIVFRAADGGSPFWRGRVEAPTASFTDSLRPGPVFTYAVVARASDGSSSAATVCAPPVEVS